LIEIFVLKFAERFDHLPENDHCDKITAISGCSRLKLIATGSLDGTLRIWNGKNQLIRFVENKTIFSILFSF
jgi:WD40 repeat protein